MTMVNINDLHNNTYEILDQAIQNNSAVNINTENGNAVLLSEGEYNNIMKAVRNAEYLAEIDKAAAQFEAGKGQIHELIEVEDDE